jgi:hypothetical protein
MMQPLLPSVSSPIPTRPHIVRIRLSLLYFLRFYSRIPAAGCIKSRRFFILYSELGLRGVCEFFGDHTHNALGGIAIQSFTAIQILSAFNCYSFAVRALL